jgi:hypothetical protein
MTERTWASFLGPVNGGMKQDDLFMKWATNSRIVLRYDRTQGTKQ